MADGSVQLKLDRHKLREAILYLLQEAPNSTQYEVVKALFLADRAHLQKFGRPITFDSYVAMESGPVPSSAYDQLKASNTNTPGTPWVFVRDGLNPKKKLYTALRAPDLEYLSETDLEMLRWAMQTVRRLSFDQLKKLTHEDPAYIEAWARRGTAGSVPMKVELLIGDDGEGRAEELEYISKHT